MIYFAAAGGLTQLPAGAQIINTAGGSGKPIITIVSTTPQGNLITCLVKSGRNYVDKWSG